MYTDLYLKFADQAEADSILYTVHPEEVDEEGVIIVEAYTTPNYANIDTLGILYVDQLDPDVPPVPKMGWHVNIRLMEGEDDTLLAPYKISPSQPNRTWA